MYVLGPNIQFTGDGDLIPVDQQKFVWVQEIIDKVGFRYKELAPLPMGRASDGLEIVLRTLEHVTGPGNVYSGILVLGE